MDTSLLGLLLVLVAVGLYGYILWSRSREQAAPKVITEDPEKVRQTTETAGRRMALGARIAALSMVVLAVALLIELFFAFQIMYFDDFVLQGEWFGTMMFALVDLCVVLDMGSRVMVMLGRRMGGLERDLASGFVAKSWILTFILGAVVLFDPVIHPQHERLETAHLGLVLLCVTNLLFAMFWHALVDHLGNQKLWRVSVAIFWVGLILLILAMWIGSSGDFGWGLIFIRLLGAMLFIANGFFLWSLSAAIRAREQKPLAPGS